MSWITVILDFLKKVLDYLSGPKALETVNKIANVVGVIVLVLDMFASEAPSNIRKREYAWAMLKFLKVVPMDQFELLVDAKRSGALDTLQDFEMDATIGIVLAEHIKNKTIAKQQSKPLGTKP